MEFVHPNAGTIETFGSAGLSGKHPIHGALQWDLYCVTVKFGQISEFLMRLNDAFCLTENDASLIACGRHAIRLSTSGTKYGVKNGQV